MFHARLKRNVPSAAAGGVFYKCPSCQVGWPRCSSRLSPCRFSAHLLYRFLKRGYLDIQLLSQIRLFLLAIPLVFMFSEAPLLEAQVVRTVRSSWLMTPLSFYRELVLALALRSTDLTLIEARELSPDSCQHGRAFPTLFAFHLFESLCLEAFVLGNIGSPSPIDGGVEITDI